MFDVTDDLKNMHLLVIGENLIKAERREKDLLILQKRIGGWCVNYWWLESPTCNLNDVVGSEVTFWKNKEINPEKSLFEQITLF